MSTNKDEQIIEMYFDNAKFERNARTTMQTISELKKEMNFDNVGNGFDKITKAANTVNISKLAENVEKLQHRFSLVGETFYNGMKGYVDKTIGLVKNVYDEINKVPVKSGFSEYETQINATQTIWANTKDAGTTLEQITAALEELNVYADKTIYNFTEMTRNIGTFTAAGVPLEKSVKAIQGIANLGAVSGSSSEQVSRGMYQISQALAAGVITLQDWNSIVNAGMGGKGFQKVLIQTAREYGVSAELLSKAEANFRTSLQDKWLSADIMTAALTKYTDQTTELGRTATDAATKVKTFSQLVDTTKETLQSGWTQSWTYIIGGFEEAREVFTNLSNKINDFLQPAMDFRNTALKFWSENKLVVSLDNLADSAERVKNAFEDSGSAMTGREMALKGLANVGNTLLEIIKSITGAWKDVFPPMTGEKMVELSKAFYLFTERLKNNEVVLNQIRGTFRGAFSVLGIGVTILKAVVKGFSAIFSSIKGGEYSLLWFTNYIGNVIYKFNVLLKQSGVLETVFVKIGSTIGKTVSHVISIVKSLAFALIDLGKGIKNLSIALGLDKMAIEVINVVSTMYEKVVAIIHKFATAPTDGATSFTERVTKAFEPLKKIGIAVAKVWVVVTEVFKVVVKRIKPVLTELKNQFIAFTGIKDLSSLLDIINRGGLTLLIVKIVSFVKSITGISTSIGGVLDNIKGIFKGLQDTINAFALNVKATAIKSIAISLLLLSGAVITLGAIPPAFLGKGLSSLSLILGELVGAIVVLNKLEIKTTASALLSLTVSLQAVAGACLILGLVPFNYLISGVAKSAVVIGMLIAAVKLLGRNQMNLNGVAKALLGLAVSMNMLVAPIVTLGLIPSEKIGSGVAAVVLTLLSISGAVKVLTLSLGKATSSSQAIPGTVKSLLALSTALNLLVLPIVALSFIKAEGVKSAISSVVKIVVALSVSVGLLTKRLKSDEHLESAARMLLTLSTSIGILAAAIKVLGEIKLSKLVQGFGTVIALLVSLGKLAKYASTTKNAAKDMMNITASILLIASSLYVVAEAIKSLDSISWGTLKKVAPKIAAVIAGFVGVFVALGIAKEIIGVTKDIKDMTIGVLMLSASLVVIAGALYVIQSIDFVSPLESIGGLVSCLAAISLVSVVIAKANEDSSAIKNAAGFAILSASTLVIAGALYTISSIDWLPLGASVGAMIGVVGTLSAGISALSKAIKENPIKISTSIVILSSSLLTIAGALVIVGRLPVSDMLWSAVSLTLVGSALVGACNIISSIANTSKNIMKSATTLVVLSSSLLIISAAFKMVSGMGDEILTFTGAFAGALIALSMASAILEQNTLGGLVLLNAAAGLTAIAIALKLLDGCEHPVKSILSLAGALVVLGGTAAIFGAFVGIIGPGAHVLSVLAGAALGLASAMYLATAALAKFAKTDFSGIKKNVSDLIYGIVSGVFDGINRILYEAFPWLWNGLKSLWSKVKSFGSTVVGGVKNFGGNIVSLFKSIGEYVIKGFWNGFASLTKSAFDGIGKFFKGVVTGVKGIFGEHSPSKVFQNIGEHLLNGFNIGIANKSGETFGTMTSLANGITGSFDSVINSWDPAGSVKMKLHEIGSVMGPLQYGERYYTEDEQAILDIGKKALGKGFSTETYFAKAVETLTSQQSSLKETMDAFYKKMLDTSLSSFVRGSFEAMYQNYKKSYDEKTRLLNIAKNLGYESKLSNTSGWSPSAVQNFADANKFEYPSLTTNVDYNDVNIPDMTLDETQFQNITNSMNNLGTDVSNLDDSFKNIGSAATGGGSYSSASFDDSRMVSELQGLRNDVEMLNRTIANMKIVMDSGALVGAISSEVDMALGKLAVYNGRGI